MPRMEPHQGNKWILPKRWYLALGLLGIMGTSPESVAETASHATHHTDALNVDYSDLSTSAALAEESHPLNNNEMSDESTQPDWTKQQCYKAWKHNTRLCNTSPPRLRPPCWLAASAMLAACLKAAR